MIYSLVISVQLQFGASNKMDLKVRTIENDTEEDRMLNELFVTTIREKFVEIGKEKFVLPIYFNDHWDKSVNKFEVRDDDVYVTGHMKTGTTWVHDIVNLILGDEKDEEKLGKYPFLEYPVIYNTDIVYSDFPGIANFINNISHQKGQRSIRTHLPWFLLPEQIRNGTKSPKIIHVLRNPKDTCISFYHHSRATDGYRGTFEEFCRLFLAGRIHDGPFFTNVKSYWEQRDRGNVFFVKYSELKKDLPGMIKKMADFLEKPITEKEIQDLMNCVSIESMKKHGGKLYDDFKKAFGARYNTCVAPCEFVREGKEGGYKTVMSKKLVEEFDNFEKEALAGTDLSF